jgi:hypothetical protein
MLVQLLPRKTKFLGVNFIVENHTLERPKLQYQFTDAYTPDLRQKVFYHDTVKIFKKGNI